MTKTVYKTRFICQGTRLSLCDAPILPVGGCTSMM